MTTFRLWEGPAPGALGDDPERDVPTLTHFPADPANATGAAAVLCPGGGYLELMDYEGRDCALWLNERGIAAFVLKYRLASNGYHHPAITGDITRAIRLVRSRAATLNINAHRIGVMGGSAGGHLASFAMTHFERAQPHHPDPVERLTSWPAFGILSYPLITIPPHNRNLLGEHADPALARYLSSDLHVTPETPPCFLWHISDDPIADVSHSLRFAHALRDQGVPFALHIYPTGEHGMGLGVKGYIPGTGQTLHPWTHQLDLWLREQGLANNQISPLQQSAKMPASCP